jgi:hypothetical protein
VKQILLAEETMSKAQLGARAKAMEESSFAKRNDSLRQRLRESEETKTKKQALSAASGVIDDPLFDTAYRSQPSRRNLPT